jgi:hypothetical protein
MNAVACRVLILLAATGPALAQAPSGPEAAALQQARAFIAASACPAATARPAAPPTRLSDPTVREATYHRILVEGCGRVVQRNYLALVLPDGTGRMVETLPGNTVTDPVLQRDAMQAAGAAARAAAPNCQQIRPVSADFEGGDSEPNVARRTRPWTETWVFDACGTRVAVPMRFAPSASGGTGFTASGARRGN